MPRIILAAHGRITTYFRQDIGRGWPHNGVDQGHNNMTPFDLQIMAPADGVVIATGWWFSYGKRLTILHDDGCTSLLAHHKEQLVKARQRVRQGQIIAVMGNTGTKYVHSHQELRDKTGKQLDPLKHLAAATAAGSTTPVPVVVEAAPERRNPVALGFSMTNHGTTYFAVITDGVWTAIPTASAANAISTHENVGRFTVLSVADFYEMRDSVTKAVAPVAAPAPAVLKLDAAAIQAVATAVRLDLKANL